MRLIKYIIERKSNLNFIYLVGYPCIPYHIARQLQGILKCIALCNKIGTKVNIEAV